jgi:hypothetical protein
MLLARLSPVSITPFFKNQTKILIFRGTFKCQISWVTLVPLLTRYLYMNLTENKPLLFKF